MNRFKAQQNSINLAEIDVYDVQDFLCLFTCLSKVQNELINDCKLGK